MRNEFKPQYSYFVGSVFFSRIDKFDLVALFQLSVHYSEVGNYTSERIEDRIEHQGLQWCGGISLWSGYVFDNSLQYGLYSETCFAACRNYILRFATYKLDNLVRNFFGHCVWQVHFVQNGDYFQVVVNRLIEIGDCLGLNALSRIHNQQSSFAGCNRTRNFVRKIDMTRGVYQVQMVFFALKLVFHLNGMAFDCNASFFFQVHIVQNLSFHVSLGHRIGKFQQPVCQSTLSVVDMCNYTEVSNVSHNVREFPNDVFYRLYCAKVRKK